MLAAIGVFGVMSHAVSQRTREIGVRMAIGASPYRMLGAILGEGLTQVGLGLIVGALLSLVTARLLAGLLFGVTALSVTPYVIVVSMLAVVSLIACLVPARRAMRIDPATALRALDLTVDGYSRYQCQFQFKGRLELALKLPTVNSTGSHCQLPISVTVQCASLR